MVSSHGLLIKHSSYCSPFPGIFNHCKISNALSWGDEFEACTEFTLSGVEALTIIDLKL